LFDSTAAVRLTGKRERRLTASQVTTPALIVRVGRASHTLHAAAGAAVIGRDAEAAIGIDDERVSRRHVVLEPHPDGWYAVDVSTNGMFVDGVRRNPVPLTGTTTLHLGAPDGVAVTLTTGVTHDESTQALGPAQAEHPSRTGKTDPGFLRAGQAVRARRNQLRISQRSLDRDGIYNQSALINFELGRSWPHPSTQAKLEEVLNLPAGYIEAQRREGELAAAAVPAAGSDEATEVFTDSIHAPTMARTVELALQGVSAIIADLPEPTTPDFTAKATAILADLRRLEGLASTAARQPTGGAAAMKALSGVRRTYNDVMMRAAGSPAATLGQRLYGARHRAELSLEEAAIGSGLPASALEDAEAERPVASDVAEAIENLIADLTPS
jgi:pSer/pThr/pTyr-binding forkhead associated (FHA) protein